MAPHKTKVSEIPKKITIEGVELNRQFDKETSSFILVFGTKREAVHIPQTSIVRETGEKKVIGYAPHELLGRQLAIYNSAFKRPNGSLGRVIFAQQEKVPALNPDNLIVCTGVLDWDIFFDESGTKRALRLTGNVQTLLKFGISSDQSNEQVQQARLDALAKEITKIINKIPWMMPPAPLS